MPVKSYLVHPAEGKKEAVTTALAAISGCEVMPAANQNLLILVTDTLDEAEEKSLQRQLEALPGLNQMALVSGFDVSEKE